MYVFSPSTFSRVTTLGKILGTSRGKIEPDSVIERKKEGLGGGSPRGRGGRGGFSEHNNGRLKEKSERI